MKLPIAWGMILLGWCAIAAAATPEGCSEGEKLEIAELVLQGLATPDEMIARLPDFGAGNGLRLLNRFVERSELFSGGRWKAIGDDLFVLRLKPERPGSLATKAQRLEKIASLVKQVALIRTPPDPEKIFIPDSLGGIIERDDVLIYRVNSMDGSSASWRATRTEASSYVYALATPKDAGFGMQCGMKAINAETAWDTIYAAPNVRVAIVDSGLTYEHDDLHPYAVPNDAAHDLDKSSHGTHLAGIVGALKDDTLGVVGVTWRTNITAYRFLDAAGRGTLAEALEQINLALNTSPHILLLAWGTGVASEELLKTLKEATNVLFVAAAGNIAKDTCLVPIFPAAYDLPNLISVMATTCDDGIATFSNYGEKTVDLAAPGEGPSANMRIYSTALNDRWANDAGTSMSAAFVAGAAALVLEPSVAGGTAYEPHQVKCWLKETTFDLPVLKNKSRTGGRLDLAEAVKLLDEAKCRR